MEGKVQVYTDNGKGKATATLGLAIRSLCTGRRVVIGQFIKEMTCSELKLPDYFENLSLERFGRDRLVYHKPTDEDYEEAVGDLTRMKACLEDESIDLSISNEINMACKYKLIDPKEVIDLFKERLKAMEVVLIGRYAPQEFINFANLVTEVKEVKHYYKKGLKMRLGVEY